MWGGKRMHQQQHAFIPVTFTPTHTHVQLLFALAVNCLQKDLHPKIEEALLYRFFLHPWFDFTSNRDMENSLANTISTTLTDHTTWWPKFLTLVLSHQTDQSTYQGLIFGCLAKLRFQSLISNHSMSLFAHDLGRNFFAHRLNVPKENSKKKNIIFENVHFWGV